MTSSPQLLDPATVAAQLIGAPGASAPAPAVSDPAPPAASQAEPINVTPTPDGMIDAAGRVFDPKRYKSMPDGSPRRIRYRNGKLYFQPIGGRKSVSAVSAPAAPASSADLAPAPVVPPPAPAALPTPAAPAWSEAEKAAAAAPAAEAVAPGSGAVPAEAAPVVDYSADAGKAISAGVFALAGYVFDARDETTPQKAEAAHLTDATAAWIRSTGWRGGPLAGALLAWLAYFLGLAEKPKVSAKLRDWIGSKPKPEKLAEPITVTATPVPPPAPAPAYGASSGRTFGGESAG